MLEGQQKSKWHRTKSTEEYYIWHRGTVPMICYEIDEKSGKMEVLAKIFFLVIFDSINPTLLILYVTKPAKKLVT